MSTVAEHESAACQICLHAVETGQPVQFCPDCRACYHQECWDELGGCGTYGCPRMVEIKKSEDQTQTYWGATEKKCPICIEQIPISTLVCPHCKTRFSDTRPMTREELLPQREDPALREYRRKAVWLFIFSVLGCTSPFALLIGSIWYRSHRDEIDRAGPTARALTLIGLGICVLYLGVMVLSLLIWGIRS